MERTLLLAATLLCLPALAAPGPSPGLGVVLESTDDQAPRREREPVARKPRWAYVDGEFYQHEGAKNSSIRPRVGALFTVARWLDVGGDLSSWSSDSRWGSVKRTELALTAGHWFGFDRNLGLFLRAGAASIDVDGDSDIPGLLGAAIEYRFPLARNLDLKLTGAYTHIEQADISHDTGVDVPECTSFQKALFGCPNIHEQRTIESMNTYSLGVGLGIGF